MDRLKVIKDVGRIEEIERFDNSIRELVEIKHIEEYLSEIKNEGCTHLRFITFQEYEGGCSDIEIRGCIIEQESDEDYRRRIDKAKSKERFKKLKRKKEYLKLKEEFE